MQKKSALFHHVGHGKGDGYACYYLGRSDRQKMGGKSRALLFGGILIVFYLNTY